MVYSLVKLTAFFADNYRCHPPFAIWSFSPFEKLLSLAGNHDTLCLDGTRVLYRPRYTPAGFKRIFHSLRKGVASVASCIGAPLPSASPLCKRLGATHFADINTIMQT
jgi:hypothetical protein